jgi:hypothetical protein
MEDETGTSGEGIVAEGAVFSNEMVALAWLTDTPSVVFYPDIKSMEEVHGHGGKTKLIYIDREEKDEI